MGQAHWRACQLPTSDAQPHGSSSTRRWSWRWSGISNPVGQSTDRPRRTDFQSVMPRQDGCPIRPVAAGRIRNPSYMGTDWKSVLHGHGLEIRPTWGTISLNPSTNPALLGAWAPSGSHRLDLTERSISGITPALRNHVIAGWSAHGR